MSAKLKELYARAGFGVEEYPGSWPSYIPVSTELAALIKIVVEECALQAELQARSFSDGNAGVGCNAAANAVRAYGEQLAK